jgi:hypothetical protein
LLKIWSCLDERLIILDRTHTAQTGHVRRAPQNRFSNRNYSLQHLPFGAPGKERRPQWSLPNFEKAPESCLSQLSPAAFGLRGRGEFPIGTHFTVYRNRTALRPSSTPSRTFRRSFTQQAILPVVFFGHGRAIFSFATAGKPRFAGCAFLFPQLSHACGMLLLSEL